MELDQQALFLVYVAEAEECLASMEKGLLELEQKPDHSAVVDDIFRAAHTLKGNSSSLGFQSLAELSHEVEALLELVRAGQQHAGSDLVSLLLHSVDVMMRWIPSLEMGVDRPMTGEQTALYERLRAFRRRGTAAAVAGDAPRQEEGADAGGIMAGVKRTMRIEAARMDALLDLVGEIAIATERSRRGIDSLPDQSRREIIDFVEAQETLLRHLQESVMRCRMLPIGPTFRRHLRTVRDLARSTGKQVKLVLEGEETEVDMTVVEALSDPVMHMIHNAIDHGIEGPETRAAAGKDCAGTITLRAYHERGGIVVQIADDGAGVSRQKVRGRALQIGLDAEAMSDRELLDLIFQPGFTTSDAVTGTSGRGVGMDVVRRGIEKVRGQITIDTAEGAGTTVSIRLPLTLAVIPGFRIGVGGESFVIPLAVVDECLEQPLTSSEARGILHVRGEAIPYVRLRQLFGFARDVAARELVVVVVHQQRRAGLVVDSIHGEAQTVIKPLGPLLRGLPGVTGTAVMGSGSVAMVLDAGAIFRELEKNVADVA